MIETRQGDMMFADVEALVNPVNTKGVMGRGLALRFKELYSQNYNIYRKECALENVQPGKMLVTHLSFNKNPHYIINFPTKRDWRDPSRLEDIDSGLRTLVTQVKSLNIKSIAIPALGCGLGGLDWAVVKPRIEAAFQPLTDVRALIFPPL